MFVSLYSVVDNLNISEERLLDPWSFWRKSGATGPRTIFMDGANCVCKTEVTPSLRCVSLSTVCPKLSILLYNFDKKWLKN